MSDVALPEALHAVACPACGAGYQLPLAKLQAKPRKLKCAQCGHVWLVKLTEGEPATTPEPTPQGAEGVGATVPVPSEPIPDGATDTAPEVAAETPVELPSDPMPEPEVASLNSVLQPTWKSWLVGEQKWLTLAFIMALLGLGLAGYALMQQMVPPAVEEEIQATMPTLAARQPVAAPLGVVLYDVISVAEQAENGSGPVALTLQGRVANTSERTVALPQLQAELVDESGAVNDFWPVALITTTLPAQSELPFAVSFTNPSAKGWRLVWVARPETVAPSSAAPTSAAPSAPAPAAVVPPAAESVPQAHDEGHP